MKNIFTTGEKGHIGSALLRHGVKPLSVDIRDYDEIRSAVRKARPDFIINPASKSKPTWCEKKENQKEVMAVNVTGAFLLSQVAEEMKIPMFALSSDHVFRGNRFTPYKERSKPSPVNYYGISKLAMEAVAWGFDNVKIIRTSNCFWNKDPRVLWYIQQLDKQSAVKVPLFQTRSFMHIDHFCLALLECVEKFEKLPKVLHISGSEVVSWYTFAKEFARATGVWETKIKKFRRQYLNDKSFVPRPARCGLDTERSKKLGITQYSWKDGLEYMTK